MSHLEKGDWPESSNEDLKCRWLCTTMKSTCSLDEEKTSSHKKESTSKGQE